MPRLLDARIADILIKYGEDPTDTRGVIWDCHGTWVVYHRAVERVAARAGIVFDPPTVLRAERDEAVLLVSGHMADRYEYDLGEALIGANYKVSPKQAAYPYAMALKRGRDRLILKLVGLHGLLYSEEEADDFRARGITAPEDQVFAEADTEVGLRRRIDEAKSVNGVTDLMLDIETQKLLNGLPADRREEVRDYAKARLVALGWPGKRMSAVGGRRTEPEVDPGDREPPPAPPPQTEREALDQDITKESLLAELRDRLSFARSHEEVEEGYVDFDAEALLSTYPNGVEEARSLKQEYLDFFAPTQAEPPKDAGAATDDSPGNEYITKPVEREVIAEKPDHPVVTAAEYKAKLQHMLSNAETREQLEKFWRDTSGERDACGASAQVHGKWKAAKNQLLADLPSETEIEVDV